MINLISRVICGALALRLLYLSIKDMFCYAETLEDVFIFITLFVVSIMALWAAVSPSDQA